VRSLWPHRSHLGLIALYGLLTFTYERRIRYFFRRIVCALPLHHCRKFLASFTTLTTFGRKDDCTDSERGRATLESPTSNDDLQIIRYRTFFIRGRFLMGEDIPHEVNVDYNVNMPRHSHGALSLLVSLQHNTNCGPNITHRSFTRGYSLGIGMSVQASKT
jgi:hypothetical protein